MLNTLAALPFAFSVLTQAKLDIHSSNVTKMEQLKEQAEHNSIYLKNTEQEIVLNVPFVHQKNDLKNTPDEWAGGSACGPAAITMALKFHNENYSLQEVVNKLPSSVYVKGVMFYDLLSGPKEFNYQSNELKIDAGEIHKALKDGHPVLLNIQNYDGITGHEVVVVGMKGYDENTNTAKSLIVHDPFRAPYREFEFINKTTLKQPEGYHLPIGIINPFYITPQKLASAL